MSDMDGAEGDVIHLVDDESSWYLAETAAGWLTDGQAREEIWGDLLQQMTRWLLRYPERLGRLGARTPDGREALRLARRDAHLLTVWE